MRIAVALCTRNGARYVGEQIASILDQERRVDRIVLSDDASTDGTADLVIAAVGDRGPSAPELTVFRNDPPLGVVRNFSQAIAAAGADLVALCDQDDVWEADRIERIAARFESEPDLLCSFSDAQLIDDDGQPLGASLFGRLEVGPRELGAIRAGEAFPVLLRRNLATGATMVFRRELFEAAAPLPSEWVHDEWLALVAAALDGLGVEEAPLTRYRIHSANTIGVVEPTLGHKVRRVLQPRSDRNAGLARRSAVLARRLAALGVSAETERAARRKAVFEARRARLPRARLLRVAPVVLLAATGDYRRYASQGALDIVRDLLQPA